MSNPKSRTIPDALSMYLIILVVYCIDIFFFKSDLTVLGDAFYSRFLSFLIIIGYLLVSKSSFSLLGFSKKKNKFVTGIIYGIIFSVIPLLIAMVAEVFIFGLSDISSIHIRFSPPSLSHIRDIANLSPAVAIIIYVFTSFFGSLFKETFFRGFMLKKLKTATSFRSANLVQALLYMSMTMPMLLRNLVNHYYDNTTASLGVFIVMFYIIHETLAGYKWGLLTRVTGATYVATVDHFLYVFLSNSVFITNRYVQWSFMLHTLAIQIISTGMVLVYYKINMKKLEEKKAKEKEDREKEKRERTERRKERERNNIIDEKIQEIHEISPEQYKDIVADANENRPSHRHHRSAQTKQRINESHAKQNEGLLESVSTADARQVASEYLDEKMKKSHHHSTHRKAPDNSDKIESFSTGDAAKKTEEYTDSLQIERRTPKHPHPHDKIGRDSLLSTEAIEKANADKVSGFSDDAIDDFLRGFNEKLSAESHRHRRSAETSEPDDRLEDITENFDVDSFLKSYHQESSGIDAPLRSHSHSSHHSHHHSGHSSHHYRKDDDVVSLSDVSADNFFDEYQQAVEQKKEKKKQGFIKRVRELGLIDDSASNDLL